jgi:hypothetical protein
MEKWGGGGGGDIALSYPKTNRTIKNVEFYHSTRGINSLTKSMTNKACNLSLGILWKNWGGGGGGGEVFSNLPLAYHPLLNS